MAVFNEPTKWAQTLGQDADVVAIPDTSGETDPSIDKIFPSVFSIPLAQGGRAIPRSVLNGLFKLVGDWSFYQQNGGVPTYSADFDYVVGRVILYTDNNLYKCIQANGASSTVVAPDNVSPLGSDYWQQIATLADFQNFANKDFSNIDDTAKITIAHNAMPSSAYDSLTVGASGTTYTAPADGYVFASGTVDVNSLWSFVDLSASTGISSRCLASTGSLGMKVFIPLRKGQQFSFNYQNANNLTLTFKYAVGSESEQ